MFKKIALAAALATSAAFATWDYYPILEGGKGSAVGGLYYDWDHEWSHAGLSIGARYSLVPEFELSLQGWGVQFWGETDCKGCVNGGGGLRDLTVGGRFQFDPMVNAFLDLILPIGNDEVEWNEISRTTPPSSDEIALYMGVQFSMPIPDAPGLKFGTEGGLFWGFEHDNNERGLELHMGVEASYAIPDVGITPFVGLQLKFRLTESTWEAVDENGKKYEAGADDDGDHQINLWLGATYAIIPNQFDITGKLIVRSGDHDNMGGDASGLYGGCEFFF